MKVEENTTSQEEAQQIIDQVYQEKPKGLLPGQDHEDELDYMGAAIFGVFKKGFQWIVGFFAKHKDS